MKNSKKGFIIPLVLVVVVLGIGGGVYFYSSQRNRSIQKKVDDSIPLERQTASSTEDTIASSTKIVSNQQPKLAPSQITPTLVMNSCEAEVKKDISNLKLEKIEVRYVEGKSFGSLVTAKDFFLSRGFKNEKGYAYMDLEEIKSSSNIFVALIGLKSDFPIEGEEGRTETLEVIQPIVCGDGKIISRSKNFLNEVLKNEEAVRREIYTLKKAEN